MIGWAIEQGKAVDIKYALRGVFMGRACQNWAVLLFLLKKVSVTKITSAGHTLQCVTRTLTLRPHSGSNVARVDLFNTFYAQATPLGVLGHTSPWEATFGV